MNRFNRVIRSTVAGAVLISTILSVGLLSAATAAQQDPDSGSTSADRNSSDAGTPPLQNVFTEGVPVCADPGATMWHNLVRRNADGSIACTYGHEHGDDPHQLDRTFGPMGGWWNHGQEQDLSYPWETMNENETKHSSYKIIVRGSDAQPLQPWYTIGSKNYIKAFRGIPPRWSQGLRHERIPLVRLRGPDLLV
jgi:hypothetical protein